MRLCAFAPLNLSSNGYILRLAQVLLLVGLIERVRLLIERFNMTKPGDRVLVGVSGGPDSIALLHILWTIRDDLQILPCVVHLNHQLRGEESTKDAQLVKEFAEKLSLPCFIENIDVKNHQKKFGMSLQEAAREVRFAFFEQLALQLDADRVALGHHADDQAETILLNLLRGTGLSGLKGIPYVRSIYIRPLLEVRRREIEDYCRRHLLPVRLDSSNLKPVYTRNRIRLQLLPVLERDYNPQIVHALVRLGYICREEDAYLKQQATEVYRNLSEKQENGGLALNKEALRSLPPFLCRRILRLAWQEVTGETKELSYYHVEQLMEMLQKRVGGRVLILPRQIRVIKTRSFLCFSRCVEPQPVPPYQYPLVAPGMTYVPEIDLHLKTELLLMPNVPSFEEISPKEALLDYDVIKEPLWVRRRQEGDVFSPLGLGGRTIKLKKFLIDSKIPRYERDWIPLVVSGKDIVWVGGLRPAETFKVTVGTTRCLYLRIIERRMDNHAGDLEDT